MGNCECLHTLECKQCHTVLTEKSQNIKLMQVAEGEQCEKTSLMSFSRMSMSNLSEFRTKRDNVKASKA